LKKFHFFVSQETLFNNDYDLIATILLSLRTQIVLHKNLEYEATEESRGMKKFEKGCAYLAGSPVTTQIGCFGSAQHIPTVTPRDQHSVKKYSKIKRLTKTLKKCSGR
jgi:hypothetical protein